jgi:hypothetical protein
VEVVSMTGRVATLSSGGLSDVNGSVAASLS